jgi:lipoate-protein ligase B
MSIEIKISNKLIPYNKAINLMEKRVADIKKGKKNDLIWILEHPTVFTAGIRSNKNEILDKKIRVIRTNRGGKITLHSPGQKIIYFVFNLNNKKKDIRNFVNKIEDSIIEFLKIYKIQSKSDRKNIGIWVNNKKIAAIGIKIKNWIAYHGCSINIKK